jgi:cell division protein FtsB
MRILIIFLILLLAVLQYKLWFSSGGITETWGLKKEVAAQKKENDVLYKRDQILIAQIKELKQNKKEIENIARERMGMVKKGEQYYQLTEEGVRNENIG